MREVPCALCGSDRRRPLHDVAGWREPVRIVRCRDCGHVYRSPRPDGTEADGYYDEDYYRGGGGEGAYDYADEREPAHESTSRVRARHRLACMERTLGATGRLLEVGCSFGLFLAEARRRGWRPVGVDVSEYAATHARETLGLDVRTGHVEEIDEAPGSFDAAYLSETIEHLVDPAATLRRLAELIREDGLIVIGTGNVGSLASRLRGGRWGYFMPGHLHYFSIRSLRRALADAGFDRVEVHVPDERGYAAVAENAAAAGASRCRAVLGRMIRSLRLGSFAVGAGMVAYGRRAGG